MSYKPSNENSFGEYQLGEGFGSAVHGDISRIDEVSKLAEKGATELPAGLQGLNGYVSYPSTLQEFPNFNGGHDSAGMSGVEQYSGVGDDAFAGFEGIEDDAFAGYSFGEEISSISRTAQDSVLDDEDDDSEAFDGYGTLSGMPEESFHTFFHKASMASTESDLIKQLAKAVQTVNPNTPMAVRKQYYDLVREMLVQRKKTNLKHLDIQRAEIESNIGWLVNPGLPKTGGFNAVLKKAVGNIGARLGKGEKDDRKSRQGMAVGRHLKQKLAKQNQLAGLGGFGEGSKMTYLGLGLAGIAIAGIIYYLSKSKAAAPAKKRKRRKRK